MKKSFVFLTAIFICSLSFAQNFVNPEDVSLQNDYVEASINERFFLAGNKTKKTITCFETVYDKDLYPQLLQKWQIPRYWENEGLAVQLSNNGEYCILDNRYGYTEKEPDKNDVLFWVYKNGKLYDAVKRGRYLKAVKKVLEAQEKEWSQKIKLSKKVEINDIRVYNKGLRLATFWFDDMNEDAIYETFLWYDFDSKKFEDSLELAKNQCSNSFYIIAKKFSDAESLIKDKADKEKFRRVLEKIMPLAKEAEKNNGKNYRFRMHTYEGDGFKLTVTIPRNAISGIVVLEEFTYSDSEEVIVFYILDDIYDFAIRVRNGGKISPEHTDGWTRAQDLVYLFETKKGIVKILGKESL